MFLKLNVFVFRYEAKILRITFWQPDFSIWQLKKISVATWRLHKTVNFGPWILSGRGKIKCPKTFGSDCTVVTVRVDLGDVC